ncbi:asparagine synthase C-terminal domain-containing protein [Patescibacteria group bacterium]|nr:asparagine synthase C-terminal domain-containing protein [Patescibacteria group bacterium]
MNSETQQFIDLFSKAIDNFSLKKPVAIIYSGGLDSSLVAFCAHQIGLKVTSFTVGFPDSPDFTFVNQIKDKLPFPAVLTSLSQTDLIGGLPLAKKLLKKAGLEDNLMQLSLTLATQLVAAQIGQNGFTQALSGQGADEIFAGYYRALALAPKKINPTCRLELQRLQKTDVKREKAIADHYKLEVLYPYLNQSIIDFGLDLDPKLKLKKTKKGVVRKHLLRQAAASLDLPKEIVNRPKQAFQYSSRVQRELIKILKKT